MLTLSSRVYKNSGFRGGEVPLGALITEPQILVAFPVESRMAEMVSAAITKQTVSFMRIFWQMWYGRIQGKKLFKASFHQLVVVISRRCCQ